MLLCSYGTKCPTGEVGQAITIGLGCSDNKSLFCYLVANSLPELDRRNGVIIYSRVVDMNKNIETLGSVDDLRTEEKTRRYKNGSAIPASFLTT